MGERIGRFFMAFLWEIEMLVLPANSQVAGERH
jgi:hypothetical protein